ncbi:hypothetical protein [Microcoleus sp. OTE_8_concoct_300]
MNIEMGSPARPTRIVEKLTVKLDAQQLKAIEIDPRQTKLDEGD